MNHASNNFGKDSDDFGDGSFLNDFNPDDVVMASKSPPSKQKLSLSVSSPSTTTTIRHVNPYRKSPVILSSALVAPPAEKKSPSNPYRNHNFSTVATAKATTITTSTEKKIYENKLKFPNPYKQKRNITSISGAIAGAGGGANTSSDNSSPNPLRTPSSSVMIRNQRPTDIHHQQPSHQQPQYKMEEPSPSDEPSPPHPSQSPSQQSFQSKSQSSSQPFASNSPFRVTSAPTIKQYTTSSTSLHMTTPTKRSLASLFSSSSDNTSDNTSSRIPKPTTQSKLPQPSPSHSNTSSSHPNNNNDSTSNNDEINSALLQTLTLKFGHTSFRPGQLDILRALLPRPSSTNDNIISSSSSTSISFTNASEFNPGRDAAAFWSTGSGKSICYQLLPFHLNKVAVIISPLVSLMEDQVARLNGLFDVTTTTSTSNIYENTKKDVACFLGSAQSDPTVEQRALNGEYSLVYCTPEKIVSSNGFLDALGRFHNVGNSGGSGRGGGICLVAVDEAHCVRYVT